MVLKPEQQLDAGTLIERIKPKLGGVKTPKTVEFWDAIPKTVVGKTDKKVIRAKFWSDEARAVH